MNHGFARASGQLRYSLATLAVAGMTTREISLQRDRDGHAGTTLRGARRCDQYFSSADAQVKPPPNASSNTFCPRLILPERTASSSASGTEPDDVLP
jgi:hypothetical protein